MYTLKKNGNTHSDFEEDNVNDRYLSRRPWNDTYDRGFTQY